MFSAVKLAALSRAIYANRTLWLRTETLSLNNGDLVTNWTNSGTAGGSFTQASGSAPQFNANQVNGKPAVTFTPGKSLTSTLTVANIFGTGQNWTFVVVARAIGTQGDGTPGAVTPPIITSSGGEFLIYVSDLSNLPHISPTEYLGGVAMSNVAYVLGAANAASGSHHIFNSAASANANLPSLPSGTLSMGRNINSGQTFNFFGVLEIMGFNVKKTPTELASIASALRAKYAIT